jgi:aldehyde dehydrogenase (NAD+)
MTIKRLVEDQRAYFDQGHTLDISFRKKQLKRLKESIQANEGDLYKAIYNDFRKSKFDTYTTELALVYHEIDRAVKNLSRWAAPEKVPTNLVNFPASSYIVAQPLGVSLVIGAWNYPYQLSLGPCVAAMAAGCTVVLKPSELPAQTSAIMAKIVGEAFDPRYFAVVEGGVDETTRLLEQRFDKIFFTGSTRVGRIVYQAAAQHLTPVTLEMGGKSPAIVCSDARLAITVKRLVWAKFLNAGQTCIAPDYVLVNATVEERFLQLLKEEIEKRQYAIENDNYVQIINKDNYDRLIGLIDDKKVFYGGEVDAQNRFIAPTVLRGVELDDAIMAEEIFGPLLPVMVFNELKEAIDLVKSRPNPLACYVFTQSKRTRKEVIETLSFGGGMVNDAVMHIANPHLPFGGVGESGIGAYHGERGFKAFSHEKSIVERSVLFEPNLKYSPLTKTKFWLIRKLMGF